MASALALAAAALRELPDRLVRVRVRVRVRIGLGVGSSAGLT